MDMEVALPRAVLYAEREARVWSRLWRGSVFSGVLMPVLFLGAMGLGLGGLVDENSGKVAGLDYLSFVAPGLLVAGAVQNASGAALWQVMAGIKWIRSYHAAVATPLRPSDVFTGYLTWIATLVALHSVPFLVIAALLGGIPSWWGVLAIPVTALSALAFCAPLAAYTATRQTENSFPVIIRLIVLPLFLFSGTFFPLDQLPAGLRPIAWFTPLWHGVELARAATTGSVDLGSSVLVHIGFLVSCVVLGIVWGARSFTERLTP